MDITITGSAKEIAALVLELQKRQGTEDKGCFKADAITMNVPEGGMITSNHIA